jgi:Fungal specific transcription factor domain
MGLFRHENQKSTVRKTSVEEEWHDWIEEESLRRLGWAVYKYDASVAYLHNNRPFLSTGDINLNMPASAEHWAAESAYTWADLHP